MARRKPVPVYDAEQDDDDPPPKLTPVQLQQQSPDAMQTTSDGVDDEDDGLFQIPPDLLMREAMYIAVHRIDSMSRKKPYLGRYDCSDFNLEKLKEDHGGGSYWVRLVGPNPANRGRQSQFWMTTVDIAGPPKEYKSISTVASNDNGTQLAQMLLQGMQEGFRQLADQLRPAPAKSTMEVLQEMKLMRDVFAPAQAESPMTLIKEVFSVVKELNPPEPSESPGAFLMQSADKIIPMIATVLENSKQAQPQLQAVPNPQPLARIPQQPQPQEQDVNAVQRMQMKMGLQYLCGRASVKGDPALYADVILEQMPDDELSEFVNRADWFNVLCSIESECGKHQEWFNALRDAVVEALESENDESADDLTSDENSTTKQSNGQT